MSAANESDLPHIRPVLELFRSNALVFWATTYNIDLALFNEFLLGRLGDPPLNIAVLADQQRLDATLSRISPGMVDQISLINRRWLLRGVQYGVGRFHPKSYLAVTPAKTILLVGSGNLSTSGLDKGREVFTEFRSGTDRGDEAITAWRSWMQRLVNRLDDTRLAERFADLESKLPSATRPRMDLTPMLVENLDETIAAQLIDVIQTEVSMPIDELLVTAPFFDEKAEALDLLISQWSPLKISVYTTSSTKVSGTHLERVLRDSGAEVHLFAYEPDRFTHAKLIGVVAGENAWVLSGSANLSQAALTLTAVKGNVELAVLASAAPSEIRTLFIPPGTSVRELPLKELSFLNYTVDTEVTGLPVRLIQATAHVDGLVEIRCEPILDTGWQLDDLAERRGLVRISSQMVTDGPLSGRLVFIVDQDGIVLSNRVVVDDAVALAAILNIRSRSTDDRPPELMSGDLETPLGRALSWLHRKLVMDVSEIASPGAGSGGVGSNEADSATDDDLWERLEREKLGRDPRANTYGRILGRTAVTGSNEPILELLEAMRGRVPTSDRFGDPGRSRSVLAHLLALTPEDNSETVDDVGEEHVKRRWKAKTRIRVRARNVLRRWAAAQTDPRLAWIDQMAPAANFAMISRTFARLWLVVGEDPKKCELQKDDLNDLWFDWMRPFVGTGRGDGWFDHIDPTDPAVANRLPEDLAETVSALCWIALRQKSRHIMIAWQPVLNAALQHGLLEPTDETARFVGKVSHTSLTRSDVEGDLLRCVEFIDDDMWCERTMSELNLTGLEIHDGSEIVSVRLVVRGINKPLNDPRIPELITAARRYRRCEDVAIFSEDAGWRLAFRPGEPISYLPRIGGVLVDSQVVEVVSIERLASKGGVLGDLFIRNNVA
jgi:HKD family nuclease